MVTIRDFKMLITSDDQARVPDLRIATIPVVGDITYHLVYEVGNGAIISSYFLGVDTNLNTFYDGNFISGNDEYPTIKQLLMSNELAKSLSKLPCVIQINSSEYYFKDQSTPLLKRLIKLIFQWK